MNPLNKFAYALFVIAFVLACLASAAAAVAPVAESEDEIVSLAPLVVVASKRPRPVASVIGSVQVLDAAEIDGTHSERFADAIRYLGEVNIENSGGRFAPTGVNIRGIGGNRVAIEVDGVPAPDVFAIGSYASVPAQLPETDLIERVEILKGPASTLYGSDAIGGVVSVTTWSPQMLVHRSPGDDYRRVRLAYDGRVHGRVLSAAYAQQTDDTGQVLSFTRRDGKARVIHPSAHALRDFNDWDEHTVYARWQHDVSDQNELFLSLNAMRRSQHSQLNGLLGIDRFSRTTELLGVDDQRHRQWVLGQDFTLTGEHLEGGLWRVFHSSSETRQDSFETRRSRSGEPLLQFRRFDYRQRRTGVEFNLHHKAILGDTLHRLVSGFEWMQSTVSEYRDGSETHVLTGQVSDEILGESFPRRDFPDSDVQTAGVFIHDEIDFADSDWHAIAAVRFDRHRVVPHRDALFDAVGGPLEVVRVEASDVSPKVAVMRDFARSGSVYLQYVHGFRAPPFADVNIGLNIPQFNIRAIPNPELKSERSHAYELGFRLAGETHRLEAALFSNRYRDFIESRVRVGVDPETQTTLFQSINLARAEIHGFELSHAWRVHPDWLFTQNWAWSKGKNRLNGQPLNSVSPAKASLSLQWAAPQGHWSSRLYAVINRRKSAVDDADEALFVPPSSVVFDWLLAWQSRAFEARFALFNLGNKKHWDWQQTRRFSDHDPLVESLSEPGRTASLSLSWRW